MKNRVTTITGITVAVVLIALELLEIHGLLFTETLAVGIAVLGIFSADNK